MNDKPKSFKRNILIVTCIIIILSVPFFFFANEGTTEEPTYVTHDLVFGETDKLLYEMVNETEIFDTMDISSPDKRVEIIVELNEQPMTFDADRGNSTISSSLVSSHYDVKNQIATLFTDIESIEEGELYLFEYSNQPTVTFLYDYYIVMNGFSLEIEQQYLEQIQNLQGVKNAYISGIYETTNPLASDDYSLSSGEMINIYGDESGKYTGKGTSIAILDSGLEINHSAFSGEFSEDNIKHEKNQISNILSNLQADISNIDSVYKNNKIPFAYDYADKDTEVQSGSSANTNKSHGNHVTGIASGNSQTFKGVAPNSQIVFMKVVSDKTSVATDGTIFAALEDCVVLDVDIINMSLSLAGGFSYATYEPMNDVLSRITSKGINIVSAAGNDNNAALANPTDTGLPLAKNPDYSIIGSPGSYNESLSVASNINTIKYDETGKPEVDPNKNAYQMSNFSSWGVTPDLKLKPEITAPGEGILSSIADNQFGIMHGTSMSSPHIAGGIALIKEYMAETDLNNNIINSLIMNTATPIKDDSGNYYSPRKQGAGLANINSAVKTKAYISVNGNNKPKGDLGYNQTGNFDFKFTVHNLSDEKLNFNLKPIGLSETTKTINGNDYFSLTTGNYTNNGINFSIPNDVTIEPNASKEVSVNISLDGGFISMLNSSFPNGTFIDGFIILESENNVSLTIPFMGFYGDWYKIPVFDLTAYEPETSGVYETGIYSLSQKNSSGAYPKVSLGKNKVNILKEGNANRVKIEPDRFAIGEKDYALATQIGLLRNANVLNYSLTNEDGTEIKSYNYTDVRKSTFKLALFGNSYAEYGLSPYPLIFPETLGFKEGKYNYSVKSNFPTENNISIDFQYDKTAPSLENYAYNYDLEKKTKSLILEVEENHFLGGLQMVGGEESDFPLTSLLIVENPDSDQGEHENNFYTIRINITNLEKYLLANDLPTDEVGIDFYDYVLNGALYKLALYKEELYTLCLEAEKIEPFGYTDDSFETFKTAFENAKIGLEDISIVEEINTLYEVLNLAMENLDSDGTPTTSKPTSATPTDTSETNNATPTDTTSTNSTVTSKSTTSSNSSSSAVSSSELLPTSRTTTTTEKPITSQTITSTTNSNPTIPIVSPPSASLTPSQSSSTKSSYRSSPSSSSYKSSASSSSSASKSSSPSSSPKSSSASPSVSSSPPTTTSKRPVYPLVNFSDVNGEWFEVYINNLVSKGSIKGYPDNTFRPNNKITRAEFIRIIVNLFELKLQPKSNRFTDTKTHWATTSIDIAFSNDVIKGVSSSNFQPDREITREEIAVVLSKFLINIEQQNLNFTDATSISSWSRNFVGKLSYAEIINGYEDNNFRPSNPATRAEAVTMIVNTYYSEYAKSNQK